MSHENIVSETNDIRQILQDTKRIAVIGMKSAGAAFGVPRYMKHRGYEIIGVNPAYESLLGQNLYDRVDEIDEEVDMVNIFRRSSNVPGHVDEILNMKPLPKFVWFQVGIRHDEAAERLAEAGIKVVQDRCIKVDHSMMT